MKYIILGAISFIFMFIFDIYTLKNKSLMKRIFGIIGLGLFLYSTIQVILVSGIVKLHVLLKVFSGFFYVLFLILLLYSLFLELPFVKTYGKDKHNNDLVDTGTYALCRHPGVLWFGFMFIFLFLSTGKILILYAGIIWTIIDIIYVYLQEKFIFIKMFPKYKKYLNTTPMLIPNTKSIRRCFKKLI